MQYKNFWENFVLGKITEYEVQYKKFGENFFIWKKLLNQKWNLEKTLYIEKNLLLKSKMKMKYFIKK